MKIVLTDAQTVLDDIVNADVLNRFGEVESFGLLKYEEVAEKIADADIVVCNKTLLDSHTMRQMRLHSTHLHSFLNISITLRNIIGLFRTASGKEAKLFHRLYIR